MTVAAMLLSAAFGVAVLAVTAPPVSASPGTLTTLSQSGRSAQGAAS